MNIEKLSDVMVRELVFLDQEPFSNKEALFDFLTEKFEQAGAVTDAEHYREALEHRENLGSTYMGNLIALPHGRSSTVVKPRMAFCRCKTPFEYQSADESGDVKFIFMIAVSDKGCENDHLRILAMLSQLLMHEDFLEALSQAESYEDILKEIEKRQMRDD